MLNSPAQYSNGSDDLLSQIQQIKVDDLYCLSNLFHVISDETVVVPAKAWQDLIHHPYTTTYIKHNLSAFIRSVISMTKRNSGDTEFIRETVKYLHTRLMLEKNRRRVYCEVVGGLLEFLVMHYHTSPEVKLIFDDIILCREAVSLLEAHLLVNMSNYTDSLLKSIVSLDTENLYSTLFEILCCGLKSKNRNKILLKIYVFISDTCTKTGVQESLLELLNKNLIYQVKEDEELGNIVTNSLAKSLASLEGDEYCKVAAKVLPLNHCLVDIERACCYCNDLLLIQLFETYYKLGKLLQLFQSILCHYSPFVSLGKDSRSKLKEISSNLTERQTENIAEHLCTVLEVNITKSTMTLANKVDVVDAKFQEFAADCCVVVLSNASHPSLGPSYGVFMRLKQIIGKVSPVADTTLKLFFNNAVFVGNLPGDYFCQVEKKVPENETELELLISSLQDSDDITKDLDTILSLTWKYPALIWSKLLYFYNHMHVEQMFNFAKNSSFSENCKSETFSRLKDLQSVIVVQILLQSFGEVDAKLTKDPLVDITLGEARELITDDINDKLTHNAGTRSTVDILHQISLDSCYTRLATTAWMSFCRKPQCHIHLMRFLKPPSPYTPLPVIHGKLAGQALCKLIPDKDIPEQTEEVINLYLRVGLPISSVDITTFIEFLSGKLVECSSVVYILTNIFCLYPNTCNAYHGVITKLKNEIEKMLTEEKDILKSVTLCNLVISSLNLASIMSADTEPFPQTDRVVMILKKTDLKIKNKMELAQTFLNMINDKDSSLQISHTLISILRSESEVMETDSNDKFTLKSNNSYFINEVIRSLPDAAAQDLLCNTVFSMDIVESIGAPYVPISMVPKMITKLSKDQVITSISMSNDAKLISVCLLCIVQSNYPAHLFTWAINKLFSLVATELYVNEPDMISNIFRSCELFSKQKEVAKHHAPYVLLILFESISHSNSVLVKDVTPCVYPLFDVCLIQGLQFLQARLSAPARQLFVQLQGYYKQNIKYQGKA